MGPFGIGQPVSRFEDPRLLRGEGRFIHDLHVPGEAHLVLVRSPHAHARIRSIDLSAARSAPGVLGVFTGEDLARDGLGTPEVTIPRKRPDGSPMFWRAHPGLASERVRYVGDPVVAVVAQSVLQAKDASEQVAIEYEDLRSATVTGNAYEPGTPPVWDECPDNICNVHEVGDAAATEAAFARAARIVKRRYAISRVHAQFMEPRGALGQYDAGDGRYTLHLDVQYPHRVRDLLASRILKIPAERLRVVAGDVGGAFGAKGWTYFEHRLVLWLAKKLGRPVKWTCERSEAPLADEHGRDCVSEAELALDEAGRFLALRARITNNLGAYVSSDRNLLPTFANLGSLVGMYAFPAAHVRVLGVFTNTSATAPYRGSGRPEATYVLERLIDDAARELGVDRVELRRRNLVPASAMPYKTALTFTYDCGEFERVMDKALALGEWQGFGVRREEAKRRGRLRGIGIANAIERAGSPPAGEFAQIRFDTDGSATLFLGTKNQGQGHETTFRQIACERLGLAPEDFRFVDGDTALVAQGMGSYGSRSTTLAGSALWIAAERIIVKGRQIAAHLLEANEADIAFSEGRYSIAGTDRGVTLMEVAKAAFIPQNLPQGMAPGLDEHATFTPPAETFPNGCHVCEVEIDPETGAIELAGYRVVDDVGTEINPLTLKGQIMGGIVQGAGQILMEQMAYDPESGQLLTASFMDYAMPRAGDLCNFQIGSHPVPTKLNPLGVKGAGEAGTVGAMPAVMNAIVDALAPLGVRALDMPATPERVWRAIRGSRRPS
ncbi:MAG: xanthine dehydrogenase family protein molybdopterin-binding subunit [Betaproteobacteria bacterium]|nr:xanthine dehydrogenase family protein molybdopterin-binding subunit [Betaproteobacteria bacterium]